jgi:hypothetical protein
VLYITQTRLMRESEQTLHDRATSGDEVSRRVCAQLLADGSRYTHWHARHETHMSGVAAARRREHQVLQLRAIAIEQLHRTALVRYLRDQRLVGAARDETLRAFYGINDTRGSTLAEHRTYLLAASTELCTRDLLDLVGDRRGLNLVRSYELAYTQYFGMYCDQARAVAAGRTYLLAALLPEVRDVAQRLRLRILAGELLPVRSVPSGFESVNRAHRSLTERIFQVRSHGRDEGSRARL